MTLLILGGCGLMPCRISDLIMNPAKGSESKNLLAASIGQLLSHSFYGKNFATFSRLLSGFCLHGACSRSKSHGSLTGAVGS
jgi:hypothetical protein